jgi:uncharacterized membrane protein
MPLTIAPGFSKTQFHVFFVAWLFTLSALISVVVPAFQSPDEFEHITRAYLLGKGKIILDAPVGQPSGGLIDTGLNDYMNQFAGLPFHPARKLTQEQETLSREIRWTGDLVFRPALGMAYYFPAIYVVHTAGLKIGEALNLTIADSYMLCRLILLLTISVLLFYSFQLHAPTYVVYGLLLIPMSIFQFASASLDGISVALSIFIVSCFLKLVQDQSSKNKGLYYAMIGAWALLASSRLQLFPLILLVLLACYKQRDYRSISIAILSAICVLGWQLIALKTVVDGRVPHSNTSAEILLFYLKDISGFVAAFYNTLTDKNVLAGYFSSFFGLLGWLDTAFPGGQYKYFLFGLFVLGVCSIHYKELKTQPLARILLLLCAASSLFIIFLAMLLTWTPHPAVVIEGIQGRYFLIPCLLVAYGASAYKSTSYSATFDSILLTLVFLFGLTNAILSMDLLLDRYFLQTK